MLYNIAFLSFIFLIIYLVVDNPLMLSRENGLLDTYIELLGNVVTSVVNSCVGNLVDVALGVAGIRSKDDARLLAGDNRIHVVVRLVDIVGKILAGGVAILGAGAEVGGNDVSDSNKLLVGGGKDFGCVGGGDKLDSAATGELELGWDCLGHTHVVICTIAFVGQERLEEVVRVLKVNVDTIDDLVDLGNHIVHLSNETIINFSINVLHVILNLFRDVCDKIINILLDFACDVLHIDINLVYNLIEFNKAVASI